MPYPEAVSEAVPFQDALKQGHTCEKENGNPQHRKCRLQGREALMQGNERDQ